jgi:hypothetical protein
MISPDPAALPIRAQVLGIQAGVEANLRAPAAAVGVPEPAPALPWQRGERLQGQVESPLPGGRFLVRIAEFAFDMQLPADARVGDKLQLAFAGAAPRPQFLLARDEPLPTASARLDLSREGRALAAALAAPRTEQAQASASRTPAPVLLASPAALLQPAPGASAPLVAALRAALDSSGLFYESHLAEWVEGRRGLDSVMREPQAGLHTTAPPAAGRPEAGTRAPPVPATQAPPAQPAAAEVESGAAVAPATHVPESDRPAISAHALPLVRGQLETLENGQIVWTGQAWPGQPLQWRLEEMHDAPGRDAQEPVPWSTQLRLTLPRLGAVTADLQLTGNSLRLKLAVTEPAARAELHAARGGLAKSLSESGLLLAGFASAEQND